MSTRTLSFLLLTAFALLGLSGVPAHAQQSDSAAVRAAFDSIVTANTYHLTLNDSQLEGEGADWLVELGRNAHHFMIGERHGTAEIPAVAGALYERLHAAGYDHAALEIGPFAAQHVNTAVDRGGFAALSDLITSYKAAPFAFLDWKEEARLAARIRNAGGTVWGLDQEFVSSLPLHLDALAEQAETERERTAVHETRSRMRSEWAHDKDYLGNAEPEALRKLRKAFEKRGDEKALARIDALITSNQIYAPYVRDTGSFYYSGVTRENYMKRTLVDHVRTVQKQTGEAPRVFYKFGGLHSGRHPGTDLDPRVPLGTFVSEWTRTLRGKESFHMFVDCNGGQNQGSGQGSGGECIPYLTGSAQGETSPFSDHLSAEGITVIDLTALRARFNDWDFLSKRARSLIYAVDAYMTVSDVTPSTPFKRPDPNSE